MVRRLALLGPILAIAMVAASCTGGDSSPNSPSPGTGSPVGTSTAVPPTSEATAPTHEPTESPSGEAPPTDSPSPAGHTGIADLDVIVAAVLSGDGDFLADLLVMRECPEGRACEHIDPEQRGEAFPSTACAGFFSPADQARDTVRGDWGAGGPNHPNVELHAAYVTNHQPYDVPAHYALVFRSPMATGTVQYRELLTDDSGGVVLVGYGCGGELPNPDLVEEWIIEPAP